jgi:hypothetical protein
MASVRPESNNTHTLGTSTYKWATLHAVDVQTASLTTSGDVEIGGNLTVVGSSTTLDVATVTVEDPLLRLAKDNSADSVDIGFYGEIVDGASTEYVGLYRDASDGKFKFFDNATAAPTTTVSGGSTATVVANIEGDLTGNADTATSAAALTSARTISLSGDVSGSVSFDGSADADIAVTIGAGAVDNSMLANSTLTFTDGTNSEALALGATLEIGGTASEVEVAYDAASNKFTVGLPDDVNIAGDLTVSGTINATIEGTSDSANTLATARNISLGGDLGGSASFDGSSDITITATIQSGSVENTMLANDGFSLKLGGVSQEDINLGDDLNFAGTSNEVEIAYDSASNTLTFGLPSSIQAALVGNATTASAWQSSRTISLAGDLGGSVSIDGSADATLTATIQAGSVDNSMLANSAITVGDGTNSEAISLGQAISIQGTSNEVEVAYDSATNAFSVGLPSSISGLSTVSASAFSGALSGNASTASTLETSRTLSVSGDASGSVSFDGSANADIALTIASGAVENSMLANDGISLQLGGVAQEDINLGDSLNFTGTSNEVEVAYSAASNTLTFGLPSTISAALSGNASTASTWQSSRTISLAGDLGGSVSLNGSSDVTLTATIQSGSVENSMLANSGITVGDGSSSESIALGGSLVIAGTSNEVEVSYDTATDTFTVGLPSTITVDVNGNASTASALETSRTIALTGDVTGSVGFDGSSNVSISTTLAGGTALTFSDGSNSEALALGSTLTVQGTSNEVEVAYSTANDAFTIGLPSTITADLSGNASSADALSTSRTIALTGDVTGSGSFDGSSNLSISTTLAGGTALTFSDGTNSEALALGSTLTVQGTANEVEVAYSTAGDSFTVGLPDDVTIAGDLTVTGTINATIEGTADQANSLSTARTISLGGDLGGSVSFDGSADVSLTATIQTGSVENSMLANDHIGLKLGGVAQENIALGDDLDFVSGTDIDVTYNSTSNALTFALEAEIASDTTGNAATASALETARTLSVSGDASGSVSFDGSADADIALTIAAGAVDNAMLANDGISLLVDSVSQEDINLGDSLNFISGTDIDIAYNTTTNQLSFGLESEIGSDATGNAATASAWATARTISLGGDLGGSVSVDGSADATLTATIQSGSVENSMLANSGVTLAADSGSNDPVALGETITISGTANEIETAAAGSNQITIGLPDNVTVGNNLTVSNDLTVSSGDMELTDGTLSILGGGASISGTVTINGTHTINGSLIANSATMKFEDSLLELGYTNSSAVDHGFFSKHSDGDYVGVAYDQSASEFAMFKTGTKPAATVDTAAGDYELANARMGDLNASAMIASSALVNNGSQVQFNKLSFASVSGTDTTLSGSQIVGGVILRDATSDETDATATAAQIVAAMPASARVADMTFEVKIIVSNSSAGYNFTAGSGVTIVGSSSYLVDGVHNYLVRVTNATVSSEAVTFYKA